MTTTKEIYNLMCPNIECGLEKITISCEDSLLAKCPLCQTSLLEETVLEDEDSYYEEDEDQDYINTWNRDMDRYHRDAYGEPTPEEGGIRDYSYDRITYNDAGEPNGYCQEINMSKLRFSDGITIDTSGTMRVIRKSDGYYIVGQGICCPVDSVEEGQRLIARFMVNDHRTKIEANKSKQGEQHGYETMYSDAFPPRALYDN